MSWQHERGPLEVAGVQEERPIAAPIVKLDAGLRRRVVEKLRGRPLLGRCFEAVVRGKRRHSGRQEEGSTKQARKKARERDLAVLGLDSAPTGRTTGSQRRKVKGERGKRESEHWTSPHASYLALTGVLGDHTETTERESSRDKAEGECLCCGRAPQGLGTRRSRRSCKAISRRRSDSAG